MQKTQKQDFSIKNRTVFNPFERDLKSTPYQPNSNPQIMNRRNSLNTNKNILVNTIKSKSPQHNTFQIIKKNNQTDTIQNKLIFRRVEKIESVCQTVRFIANKNIDQITMLLMNIIIDSNTQILNDNYVAQYPNNIQQQNVLYLLQRILNKKQINLLNFIKSNVRFGIIRLIKLLKQNISLQYQNAKKINQGAFGQIFQGQFSWNKNSKIIIKTWNLPQNGYDRNVIYDIFNEITILDRFRFSGDITQTYDFGLNKNDYYIILKKYRVSLKDWRSRQSNNIDDNLQTYFKIYKQILNKVKNFHSQNITHYDLKADNIFLDIIDNDPQVVIGDFGESKISSSIQEEHQIHNKGTEFIKSPEMLLIGSQNNEKNDRRIKKGTTRACDIWALGCLFYEILTNEFLFYNTDWIQFYDQVINQQDILTEQQIKKLNSNQYLIDFMKFILIKQPNYRPNIDNVIERFQHIIGIICKSGNELDFNQEFQQIDLKNINKQFKNLQVKISNQLLNFNEDIFIPDLTKITNEIYLCRFNYYQQCQKKINLLGIEYFIFEQDLIQNNDTFHIQIDQDNLWIDQLPKIFDFIKKVIHNKSKILFIESQFVIFIIQTYIQEIIFQILCLFLGLNTEECYGYLSSNLINLQLSNQFLIDFSKFNQIILGISKSLKYQCLCGINRLILQRKYNVEKNVTTKICSCKKDEQQNCPSQNCEEYMQIMNQKYNLKQDKIKWGYLQPDDFIYGNFQNQEQNNFQNFIHISQGYQNNLEIFQNQNHFKLKKQNSMQIDEWVIYKCKICQIWMYAQSLQDMKIALNMNNFIQKKQTFKERLNKNFQLSIQEIYLQNYI